jgi:hypothetical protein
MIHELKILPKYFEAVISGEKTFEIRKNDRTFRKGDFLALNEYINTQNAYTGNSCLVYVDYVLDDLEFTRAGFVVMSIKPVLTSKSIAPRSWEKIGFEYSVPLATSEADYEAEGEDDGCE